MDIIQFIAVGLVVGGFSGIIGIGGGLLIVPILVYIFGWQQHMAQGTSLAMLVPPIGILAAMKYYQAGHVDFRVAGLLCIGFFIGSYFGGSLANQLSGDTMRRVFGGVMLLVSIKMILGK